jgi:hypothetical protein
MRTALFLIVISLAGCGDGESMSPADATKSVMAQAYLCGQLDMQASQGIGQPPDPDCATPRNLLAEMGRDVVLAKIRRKP